MKKSKRIVISAVLVITLFIYLLPGMVFAATAAPYGITNTSIVVGAGSTLATSTTQVGFGGRRWYVVGLNGTGINKGTENIVLLSAAASGTSVFSTTSDSTYNDYANSALQTAVNSLLTSCENREQSAMVAYTLDAVNGTQPTNQKVWALSYNEAAAVSPSVLALSDKVWWLRSVTGGYNNNPMYVRVDGTISSEFGAPNTTTYSVRAGTSVNLSKLLFVADIAGKGTTIGTMNSVNLSSETKFTILDNTNLSIAIPSAPASLSKDPGSSISLDFSAAQTGANKYVSCILVSESDNSIKYYAKLSQAANGTLSIPISASVQPGQYKLLIFNEQVTTGDNSDYACTPISINLTVTGTANTAPIRKTGVPATAIASVSVNSAYTLNLSTIFSDPDGDELSYRVYVNGSASPTPADCNYSFTPTVAGNTTLKFTAYDGAAESPSYTVTLTATSVPVTGITVTAQNGATKILKNAQIQLYYEITPPNATNKAITWSAVCTSCGSLAEGDIDAGNMLRTSNISSNGYITLTATAQDGSGKSGSLVLYFSSNLVSGISVSAATENIGAGSSVQMSASVTGGTTQAVTWSISSGSEIASISSSGLLSTTGAGTVTVRATAQDGSGVYGEKTLTIKNTQTAPSAPSAASKTASSVTLSTITGAEYSMDGTTWQSSPTFTDLIPNTSYNFYARKAGSSTMLPSPSSPALSVTTEKAVLGGSVSISGTFACGADLTAVTSALTANPTSSLGVLSYQWTRDGSPISGAAQSIYKAVAADFGKVLNVTVTAANCTGSVSSSNTTATIKGNPNYTVPTGLTAVYGDTLSAVTLPTGFTWENPSTTLVGEPGDQTFMVTYTPDDTSCYNIITGINVTITVSKCVSEITAAPSASAITYGQALSNSMLSGGTIGVSGTFTWTNETIKPSVSDSGLTLYSVTFTPTDTVHYSTTTTEITLTVNKATPIISVAPKASAITYGQSLSASTLSGGTVGISGTFAWTVGTIIPNVDASDKTAYSVTFTPTDTANYNTASTAVTLTINKATPTITTKPTASAITYGQLLTESTLTAGTVGVSGTFTWTDGTIKPSVSDSNTTEYSVTFTPDSGNYTSTTTTVKLIINKAPTSVSVPPIASAITYGQTLSSSTFSGGTVGVSGTFTWTDGTIKPSVSDSGITAYSVTFTPDSGNYASSTTTVKLTINKAPTSVTVPPIASAITYGQTLASSTFTGGTVGVSGIFTWTDATIKPSVSDSGKTAYSVTFTPDSGNYETSTTTVTLIVNKATPTITAAPTASAITYGQMLSNSVLSGGTVGISGTFSWTNGTIKPSVSDSGKTAYSVTFTPDDTSNYSTATTNITLTISKATPIISEKPKASAITYGQSLSDSALTGGTVGISGTFTWTVETIIPTVSGSGTTEYSVTFTPTDTANYNTATTAVTLIVNKATPGITVKPTASVITYGQLLSDSTLTGGTVGVSGTFTWTDGTIRPTVADSGVTEFDVTFTPTNLIDYNVTTTKVKLTVNKATPTVTAAPSATAITYEQTLSNSTLSGGTVGVSGIFTWTDGTIKPAVSDSNSTAYSVTFTPNDTANYNITTTNTTLIVNKATPNVTDTPNASAITYGQTLSNSTLSGGTVGVSGTFTWKDGTIKPAVSDNNSTAYSVTFTPDDTANYNSTTTNTTLTVNKATPTVTFAPDASAITYGQALSDSTLSGGTIGISGTFTWTNGTIKPSVSDSDKTAYPVTFTPDDTANYSTATTNITLTVNKATPIISEKPKASTITYGQSLSNSALTGGTVGVSGTFAWTVETIIPTVSGSGTTEYSVTFTPTDTANYNTATTAVTLIVNKATPIINVKPKASAITYGQKLSDSILSEGEASIEGSFSWTNGTIQPTVSDSGVTEFDVTFTPTNLIDYNVTTTKVKLTVNKATPTVTAAPSATAITYGQMLSNSTLSGGTVGVSGTFSWTDETIKPSVADSNNTAYSVTFTPKDSINYSTTTTTVTLTVNKAPTSVTTPPIASAITYGQSLSDSTLTNGTVGVSGTFTWTDGTIKPSVSDSGKTAYSVTFTPDSGNYAASTTTVMLTVNKATPSVTTAPTASAITYGQMLSNSTLSGGTVGISGTFTWTDGTIKPAVSDSNSTAYSVTFTPTDGDNYATTTTTVKLTINKATPIITEKPTASAITYGQSLSNSVLSGGTIGISGTFAWIDGTIKPSVSDSNLTTYGIIFTPTDTDNYNTVTTTIQLTVNKADPVYTIPTGLTATYGQTLADVLLPSGFKWESAANTSVGNAGSHDFTVTYTPADTANYNIINGIHVTLTVKKANSTITMSVKLLSENSIQLTAEVVGAGGPPTGTVTFKDGTVTIATVSLTNGKAAYTWANILPGDHDITAEYPGSENHNGSVVILRKFNIVSPPSALASMNSFSADKTSVVIGQTVTLTATGDRQNNAGTTLNDERYVPVSWTSTEAGKSGTFAGSTSTYSPSAAGTYTVTASFQRQVYNGSIWVNINGDVDKKSITITVSNKDDNKSSNSSTSSTPICSMTATIGASDITSDKDVTFTLGNIQVTAPASVCKGILGTDAGTLKMTMKQTSDTTLNLVKGTLGTGNAVIISFELTFEKVYADGRTEQVHNFNDKLKVTINLTDAQINAIKDQSEARLYWYDSSTGKLTDMKAVFDFSAKTATFYTDHFSAFLITASPVGKDVEAPNMGDTGFNYSILITIISIVAALTIVAIKRRDEKEPN